MFSVGNPVCNCRFSGGGLIYGGDITLAFSFEQIIALLPDNGVDRRLLDMPTR